MLPHTAQELYGVLGLAGGALLHEVRWDEGLLAERCGGVEEDCFKDGQEKEDDGWGEGRKRREGGRAD